jgi:hypothetical protein
MSPASTFDWSGAIQRNSEPLRAIIAALFAMLGVGPLSTAVHRAILSVLRPAESAVRRLIIVAARGLVVELPASRPMVKQPIRKGGTSRPSFKLFDTRKNFTRSSHLVLPRILVFGCDPTVASIFAARRAAPRIVVRNQLNVERLTRRLNAVKAALDDLPRQAKRLVRWRLRREKLQNPKFTSPLRPGRPPGSRRKPIHEIDEILVECHGLARYAMELDTS